MNSIELLNEVKAIVKYLCNVVNKQDKYVLEIIDEIKKNLEVLEIFKKHLYRYGPYYDNQENWSREEFRFKIESDNTWLSGKQREEYIKEFNTLKEWFYKTKEGLK